MHLCIECVFKRILCINAFYALLCIECKLGTPMHICWELLHVAPNAALLLRSEDRCSHASACMGCAPRCARVKPASPSATLRRSRPPLRWGLHSTSHTPFADNGVAVPTHGEQRASVQLQCVSFARPLGTVRSHPANGGGESNRDAAH